MRQLVLQVKEDDILILIFFYFVIIILFYFFFSIFAPPPPTPPPHLPLHPSYYNNVLLPAWGEVSYESRERCLGAFYVGEMLGWGGGGGGRAVTWEPVFRNLPHVYLAFEKTNPFIYFIFQNVDLFIYCLLMYYTHLLLVVGQISQSVHRIPKQAAPQNL